MTDLTFYIQAAVDNAGGLAHCDLNQVNHQLRRGLHQRNGDYITRSNSPTNGATIHEITITTCLDHRRQNLIPVTGPPPSATTSPKAPHPQRLGLAVDSEQLGRPEPSRRSDCVTAAECCG